MTQIELVRPSVHRTGSDSDRVGSSVGPSRSDHLIPMESVRPLARPDFRNVRPTQMGCTCVEPKNKQVILFSLHFSCSLSSQFTILLSDCQDSSCSHHRSED